jgi:hypothetical protein
MDLRDYCGEMWDNGLLDRFKNVLSESKNKKQELKKIFRPKRNISLFYEAVKHNTDFAAYLIQFAIENDVDSILLLGSVRGNSPLHAAISKRNSESVEMILKYAPDHGRRNAALLKPNISIYNGETPFQMAMRIEDIRSMKAIFRFGLQNGVGAVKQLGLGKRK